MSVKRDAVYETEYNCFTEDLVNGFPPDTDAQGKFFPDGAKMFVWDTELKKLTSIFKMVFGAWMKL